MLKYFNISFIFPQVMLKTVNQRFFSIFLSKVLKNDCETLKDLQKWANMVWSEKRKNPVIGSLESHRQPS